MKTLFALVLLIPSLSWAQNPEIKKFDPSKTIIHESNENIIEIENTSSKIFILIEKYNVTISNPKYEELATSECEKYKDKSFIETAYGENIRPLSDYRGKFYCSSIEEKLIYNIERNTNTLKKCTNLEIVDSEMCLGVRDRLRNYKLDLKELRLQKEKNSERILEEDKERALLESVNSKRELCFRMGFKEGTEPLANCILQLMLDENKREQVVITNNSTNSNSLDEQNSILNQQTEIMEKQLKLQKIENSQKALKSFQYMMDYGKVPPAGYGY